MSAPRPKVATPKVAAPKAVPKPAPKAVPKVVPKATPVPVGAAAATAPTPAPKIVPKVATAAQATSSKEGLKACGPSKLVVLSCCCDEDGSELAVCQQRKNMALAAKMLKEAMEAGHIEKDDKGMLVRRCSNKCNCLPQVPSSIRAQKARSGR